MKTSLEAKTLKNGTEASIVSNTVLCIVCNSDEKVEFLTITDCILCGKCLDELSEGFEQAMTMDRNDYPEL